MRSGGQIASLSVGSNRTAVVAREPWWLSEGRAAARPAARAQPARWSAPFRLLIGFTFVLLLAPQSFLPVLGQLRIALVLALAAIVAHLYGKFTAGQPLTRVTRELILAGCLAGWALATVPLSLWPGGSLSLLVGLYLKSLAVFWLLANVVDTPQRLKTMAWALVLMTVPLALSAVRNYSSGAFLGEAGFPPRIAGYDAPLTQNPNDLALVLNLLLPLTAALLTSSRAFATRTALLGLLAVQALGVVVTFSRGGFVTLAATAAFYSHRLVRRGAWGVVGLGLFAGLACLPLLPAGYLDRLLTIVDIDADATYSAQSRWKDTLVAARLVLEHPVMGVGAGMNILALNEARGARWTQVHNVYLEYASDLGLPGLALFVALLTACLRTAGSVQQACARDEPDLFFLAEAAQAGLLAFAVAGLFHPIGYRFEFFYAAGLAVASATALDARPASLPEGRPQA